MQYSRAHTIPASTAASLLTRSCGALPCRANRSRSTLPWLLVASSFIHTRTHSNHEHSCHAVSTPGAGASGSTHDSHHKARPARVCGRTDRTPLSLGANNLLSVRAPTPATAAARPTLPPECTTRATPGSGSWGQSWRWWTGTCRSPTPSSRTDTSSPAGLSFACWCVGLGSSSCCTRYPCEPTPSPVDPPRLRYHLLLAQYRRSTTPTHSLYSTLLLLFNLIP